MHCGTDNRTSWWTFTDPCNPEMRPGAREESINIYLLYDRYLENQDTERIISEIIKTQDTHF